MTKIKLPAVPVNLDLIVTDAKPRLHAPRLGARTQVSDRSFRFGCEAPLAAAALPRVESPVWEQLSRIAGHVDPAQC